MSEYNKGFYDDQELLSLASARVILGELFRRIRPASVVDVGCGLGTWLGACKELGVADVLGIDGAHVEAARLHIPADRFLARDLSQPLCVDRRFELAMSLEVAEHLPADRADAFVVELATLSDVILFSAAIPHQGGTGHVNENWAEYWYDRFRRHGYAMVDLFRTTVWDDERVAFWYRQNAMLYVREPLLADLGLTPWHQGAMPLSAIHPEMFLWACARGRPHGGGSYEDDCRYRKDVAAAFRGRHRIPDHESGYGPEFQVRFSGSRIVDRILRRLR